MFMKATCSESKSQSRPVIREARRLFFVGCIAGLAIVAGIGLIRTHAQQSFPLPAINPPGAKAAAPATNSSPSPAAQSATQQAGATANPDPSTTDAAKQCAQLLALAADLKAEVDKTSAGTLSVAVVRKANQIEQLAHKVRIADSRN
jgi:hypothetical protein